MHTPLDALAAALASWPRGALCVAYSGGPDSSALLHALTALPLARERGLRAVHVDHGLHRDSGRWAEHCRHQAAALAVPIEIVAVTVGLPEGLGVEAAARRARYAALRERLGPGELLLTAHHADDQAETLLLRAVRGAGARGLGAMRPLRHCGRGWLARPWLDLPRDAIRAYGREHALAAIDDPTNSDPRFDRGWLRTRVLPALGERWPTAIDGLVRSARRARAAADAAASEHARMLALARRVDPAVLDGTRAAAWPAEQRGELLRIWFRELGLPPPDARALASIERNLVAAAADASPCVRWRGAELRRHRGLWYALARQSAATDWRLAWDGRAPLALPAGGTLVLGAPRPLDLEVRPRRGGERIRLASNRPSQSVKHALQALGIPPWLRARAPLLWHGDTLWAVGDWLIADALRRYGAEHALRLRWLR
jgi:tRNA(Ile)-lysidine synthase